MSVTRFSITSPLSADEAITVLTDFSSRRPDTWPGIDAEHFAVHDLGANWAEVTEGNAGAWERVRYDWDTTARRVEITTRDSKLFGAGGGWSFDFTPGESGTRIDVVLTRQPVALSGKVLAALLPIIGAPSLKKSFQAVFAAR